MQIIEKKENINEIIEKLKNNLSTKNIAQKIIKKHEYFANINEKLHNKLKTLKAEYENKNITKQICKKIAHIENKITANESKLSKYECKLLSLYFGKNKNIKKINRDDLYQLIIGYENKNYINNYFSVNQLRKIKRNNFLLWKLKFQLNLCNKFIQIDHDNKLNSSIDNNKKKIQTKIQICENRKKSLDEIFRSMQYAKLIKIFANSPKIDLEKEKKSNFVIDIKNLNKYYFNKWISTKILKNIDLQIKYGEFVVILGPSGSGKTTLLNIISAMDCATYGTIIVNNKNLINLSETERTNFRKNNIGYIFQQYGLLPNLTVKENIEIGANLQTKDKQLNIKDLLKTIGLESYANYFPHELSGGQQQRVSIARSMAKNPAIIFGDEPTGAIDEEMTKQILQLFVEINKKYNTTVIIVTHNPIFAELANRVIKVRSGKIASNQINKNPKKVEELNWSKN